MSFSLYIPGDSFVYRISVQIKIISLIVFSALLFSFSNIFFSTISLLVILMLYIYSRLGVTVIWQQVKPILPFVVILLIFQIYSVSFISGANVCVRLLDVLLFSSLITLTTKSSDMIEVIEKKLFWLRYIGINPKKVGLGLSLTLRFIPVLSNITYEIKEAQKVRGLEFSIIAIAVPTIIRTLKMADDISAAIDARGYDSEA